MVDHSTTYTDPRPSSPAGERHYRLNLIAQRMCSTFKSRMHSRATPTSRPLLRLPIRSALTHHDPRPERGYMGSIGVAEISSTSFIVEILLAAMHDVRRNICPCWQGLSDTSSWMSDWVEICRGSTGDRSVSACHCDQEKEKVHKAVVERRLADCGRTVTFRLGHVSTQGGFKIISMHNDSNCRFLCGRGVPVLARCGSVCQPFNANSRGRQA